jgi:hypothetical protein
MYDFLKSRYQDNCAFTQEELASAIGLKASTSRAYINKKLEDVYARKRSPGLFLVEKINSVSKSQFVQYMSQKSEKVRDAKKEIHDRLKDRAVDSFFLAIEIYNRATQKNKTEAFCMLIVNAWELVLKAHLAKEQGLEFIYYEGLPKKSISIADCIKKVFERETNPVRKNLDKVVELRDKAVHLLIPEVNYDLSRIFQSCVINFVDFISEKYQENLLQSLSPGFVALVIDEKNKPNYHAIQENYGKRASDDLSEFMERFKKEEKEENSLQFAVPIEYKLVLTKKVEDSDIQLFKSASADNKGVIIEVAKDINKTHPHSRDSICDAINQELYTLGKAPITTHIFEAILHKEGIKNEKQSLFHYQLDKPLIRKYSADLVIFIVEKIKKDQEYVLRCKESYYHVLKKRAKERSGIF